jgi:DNA-repair protein XRCC3
MKAKWIKFRLNVSTEENITKIFCFQRGLKRCLIEKLPKLLSTGSVGLLIIDSIAAVFRSDYSPQDGNLRTKDLRAAGCQLHSLSRKYKLGILCVNQVTTYIL